MRARRARTFLWGHCHMYTYETRIKLHDTDAAGVLFFANYFRLTHEAYETFMASVGFPFAHLIHEADYLVLIVHADCDFKRPLRVGDGGTVEITAGKIGRTSFALDYRVLNGSGEPVATGNTAHVCVTKQSYNSIPLPERLKAALEGIAG